jgi:hypothetical protein
MEKPSNPEARLCKEELLLNSKAKLDSEIAKHEQEYKRKRLDGPESRIGEWEPITSTPNAEYRYFGQAVEDDEYKREMCRLLELPESFAEDSSEVEEVSVKNNAGGMVQSKCAGCSELKRADEEFRQRFNAMYREDAQFRDLCEALGFASFCKSH